jgi:hypothetical protein
MIKLVIKTDKIILVYFIFEVIAFLLGFGSVVGTKLFSRGELEPIVKSDWKALCFFISYVLGLFLSFSILDKRVNKITVIFAIIIELVGLFGVIKYREQLNKFIDWI